MGLSFYSFDGLSVHDLPSSRARPFATNSLHSFVIEGDHIADAVYADAIGAWALLKKYGVLAFDDYLWGQDMHPLHRPQPAIDDFLAEKQGEYEVLTHSYQIWLIKK